MLTITHHNNTFSYYQDGIPLATLRHTTPDANRTIIAEHTFVAPALRGQGIAGKLLDALVTYAEINHLTIHPQCSYVQAAFTRHPEKYANVKNTSHLISST